MSLVHLRWLDQAEENLDSICEGLWILKHLPLWEKNHLLESNWHRVFYTVGATKSQDRTQWCPLQDNMSREQNNLLFVT